ncbi:SPOR domain-containing protein [Teredinibacter haidensis]|uniref:SPOR domain-containing protein n=1 Tax=Teredinibacter haidensis TaxID=2731755 RepID=UPI00094915FE|nr:SPOR domain-containing protein [Teredinibacter haidensis]
MRWIFFTLLFFNVLALAWGVAFYEPGQQVVTSKPAPFAYKRVAPLVLLSEGASLVDGEQNLVGVSSVVNTSSGPSYPTKDGKPLCDMVGPFKDREQAQTFTERLAAIDIRSEIKELEIPAGARYQVYLPPEASHKAALRKLAELQAKKVDSYIIPKGELANGISLGMFSREELAKQQLVEAKAIGLDAEVNIIERTYWEIWTMLTPGEGGKMSNMAWSRAMEGINGLERRQNFCLDVASQDNIH